MGFSRDRSYPAVGAREAGLPVVEDEALGAGFVLRKVSRAANGPGLLVEVEDVDGRRLRLAFEPEDATSGPLAAAGGLAVSSLDKIEFETVGRVRQLLGELVEAAPQLALSARRRLAVVKPWTETLDAQPGRLKISDRCDEVCAFCSSPMVNYGSGAAMAPDEEVEARIRRWAADGLGTLEFVDREPTLNPRLRDFIALARSSGFRTIRLNSNGFSIAEPGRLAAYREAGLTELCVSLHAADAGLSDRITGRPGGFARKLETLRLARSLALPTVVNMVVTSENVGAVRDVARLVRSVADEPGRPPGGPSTNPSLVVSLVGPVGDGGSRPELLPAYDAVARALEEGLEQLPSLVVHPDFSLPPCRVAPHRRELVCPARPAASELRAYLDSCARCRFRPRCAGIWRAYLDRRGDDGFVPCD